MDVRRLVDHSYEDDQTHLIESFSACSFDLVHPFWRLLQCWNLARDLVDMDMAQRIQGMSLYQHLQNVDIPENPDHG